MVDIGSCSGQLAERAGKSMTRLIRGLLALRALAAGNAHYERSLTVRGRPVRLSNRGDGAVMGRFGGGWQRELGVQIGGRGLKGTVILNLWKGSVRIDPRPARSGA